MCEILNASSLTLCVRWLDESALRGHLFMKCGRSRLNCTSAGVSHVDFQTKVTEQGGERGSKGYTIDYQREQLQVLRLSVALILGREEVAHAEMFAVQPSIGWTSKKA